MACIPLSPPQVSSWPCWQKPEQWQSKGCLGKRGWWEGWLRAGERGVKPDQRDGEGNSQRASSWDAKCSGAPSGAFLPPGKDSPDLINFPVASSHPPPSLPPSLPLWAGCQLARVLRAGPAVRPWTRRTFPSVGLRFPISHLCSGSDHPELLDGKPWGKQNPEQRGCCLNAPQGFRPELVDEP